jgi:translation elongation factor P/translation initiation factor 5A
MSAEIQSQDQVRTDTTEQNLAKQRQMYERKLEAERQEKLQWQERAAAAERAAQERAKMSPLNEDEEDDEPYIDKRKLQKTLAKFGEQTKQQTQAEIQAAVQQALEEERRSTYLKENSDFNQVMTEDTIQRFATKHPRLAENILRMPEGFERQKLVYENIKALGVDKPDQKPNSVQDKIEANKRSPFYQPSGVGTAPFGVGPAAKDYSPAEQKNAYQKMQELKQRLRI